MNIFTRWVMSKVGQLSRTPLMMTSAFCAPTCLNMAAPARKIALSPYAIFIDPQLGRVGLSENEARKQGRDIRVAKLPMNAVIRALETGETRGFMKAIVDAETNHILGCAVLGMEGGEIMTIIQVAMMGKLPYTALKEGIFTHPTLAEGLNALFMTLDG